jgi:hypothetical protein
LTETIEAGQNAIGLVETEDRLEPRDLGETGSDGCLGVRLIGTGRGASRCAFS